MKTGDESTQAKLSEEALIANPSRPIIRLRGSHSSSKPIEAKRLPIDDNDDPGPDEEEPLPPPPPLVSTPDIAFQLLSCLPADRNEEIVSAIRKAIAPDADVRTLCFNGTQRIGVWLRPVVNNQDGSARDRGLERLNILGARESLTFFINSALIRRQAIEGWDAKPKRLDSNSNADPNGPIHLTGFSVSLESPDRIITRIDGFDERPWPDVDFQLTTTDTLSLSGSQVICSSAAALDVDTSWINFLTGLFLIVLPPLGIVFLVERIIIASSDTPAVNAGAGCGAAMLIPKEIFISDGQKAIIGYSRLEVSNGGIFAGGFFEIIPRSPEIAITGATQISVEEGTASLTRSYSLRTEDLLPPLQIAWGGDAVVVSPNAETTAFRFNLTGAEVGDTLTRRVALRVTDADNLVATAEVLARIYITPPPDDDDDFPPVCRVKPWMSECQEPLARAANLRRGESP
jgi:hypothetical protein